MTCPDERRECWPRYNSLVLTISAGALEDVKRAAKLTDTDTFTMAARAYVHDNADTPTVLAGVSSQTWTWDATQDAWVVELPWVNDAFKTRSAVRVISTFTASGVTSRTMDAVFSFGKADGR